MRIRIIAASVLAVMAVILPASFAAPQQYTPSVGQEGKDVIWVPTPEELIAAMLDAAKVKPDDFVMDLGSGDGRIVIAAAKRGAQALGVEFNPDMVELSKHNAQAQGVSDKANFVRADIFETDFSRATVITMYLLPDLNLRLRPKILDMKPGTRVVSHAFDMGEWHADRTLSADGRTAYLWIVPAKVAGSWTCQTPSGNTELTLKQNFQTVDGSIKVDGKEVPLKSAQVSGDQITFMVGDGATAIQYSGRVNGNSIEGSIKGATGSDMKWAATRH